MNPKDLFLAALDKPAVDRAVFLAGIDPALRPRVEELLSAHEASGEVLASEPPIDQAQTQTHAGSTPSDVLGTQTQGVSESTSTHATAGIASGRLVHYQLQEVLGSGGFGKVYRAFDEKLHRVVAVKLLAPELAAQGTARQRFLREARAAAAVRHEHVIGIYAVDEQPVPHLVMEFISGQNLQQKLDRQGPLGLKEILRIGSQIAAGLAAAHAQGLIHRDIKPSNILLENGIERVKISDFGLARAMDDSSISQSGIIAGTPQYMSPEQAEGKTLDARSDLFSLGGTLYACATGRPPFRASSTLAVLKKVVEEEPRPLRSLNPDLPDWLADIIGKLMAKSPATRFQSAKEVADLLQQHLAHEQQPGTVPMPAAVAAPPRLSEPAETTSIVTPPPGNAHLTKWGLWAGGVAGLGGGLMGLAALLDAPWQWPVGTAGAGLALAGIVAIGILGFARRGSGWKRKVELAIIGLGLLFLFAILERNGTTNFSSRLLWVLHHELTVRVPDASYTVEFWPTNDPPTRKNGYTITSGRFPFDSSASVMNREEQKIRLAPGSYWAFVRQAGKFIEQKHVTVPWGGQSVVEIGNATAAAEDLKKLQGEWQATAIRYLEGPELLPAALPLSRLTVKNRHLNWRLPKLDANCDIGTFVFGQRRSLRLSGTFGGNYFQIPPEIDYQLEGDRLTLTLKADQPAVSAENARAQGIPVPVGQQRGLVIEFHRAGAGKKPEPPPEPKSLDQVDLARQAWEMARKREAAGLVAPSAALEAEAVWLEAKIEQAEKAKQTDQVVADLKRLVEVRDSLLALARAQVEAGHRPPELHLAAAAALSKTVERLKQLEARTLPGPWQPLFDGKSLEAWRVLADNAELWQPRDGVLEATGSGFLISRGQFVHFQLRGEFRPRAETEFAVLFRANPSDRALREGFINTGILAFSVGKPDALGQIPMKVELAIDGKPLARTELLTPADRWHSFEVLAQGSRLSAKLHQPGEPGLGGIGLAGPDDLKAQIVEGPIILRAGGTGKIEIRKLEIRELPAQAEKPLTNSTNEAELKKLHGTWRMVSQAKEGQPPESIGLPLTFTFDGTRARLRVEPVEVAPGIQAKEWSKEGLLTLESTSEPRRFAIWVLGEPKRSLIGIYRIVGDRLEMCYVTDPQGDEFPTSFETKPGDKARLTLFERWQPPPGASKPVPTASSAVPAVPQPPPKLTDFETKLLAAINREREKVKAPRLVPEPRLMRAARAQADDMARWEDINHVREGRDPPTRLKEVGYPFAELAEVIGFNQRDPEECLKTWLASKGQSEALLNPRVTQVGIGTGRDAKGNPWHAVILAAPESTPKP